MNKQANYLATIIGKLDSSPKYAGTTNRRASVVGGLATGLSMVSRELYNGSVRHQIIQQLSAPAFLQKIETKLSGHPGFGILIIISYKVVHTSSGLIYSNIHVYDGPVAINAVVALSWEIAQPKLIPTYQVGYTDYDYLWIEPQTGQLRQVSESEIPKDRCIIERFFFESLTNP